MSESMLKKIKSRYSCRTFLDQHVKEKDLEEILECGRWAPSGINNQPWRLIVIEKDIELKKKLANLTTSKNIILGAPVNIIILLDVKTIYNRDKDILGIGAFIENMLLSAHILGYGTCWLGQILNNSPKVLELLNLNSEDYQLMAVISLGVPKSPEPKNRDRKDISKLLLKKY